MTQLFETPTDEQLGVIWISRGPDRWDADFHEAGELGDEIEAIYGMAIIPTEFPSSTSAEEVAKKLEQQYGFEVLEKEDER